MKCTQHRHHHDRRAEPQRGGDDAVAVGAECCGEHEQDTAGHDRLGTTEGPEREGVGEERYQPHAEGRSEQERAFARHRRHGGRELRPHESEVEPDQLERVASGNHQPERVAIEDDRQQFEEHEEQQRQREQPGKTSDP